MATTPQVTLTDNEKQLILAIRDSEYNDSPDKTAAVWVDCLWGWEGTRKFPGVMASLVKKSLAWSDGEACGLRELALELVKDEPYVCTIDRARKVAVKEVK